MWSSVAEMHAACAMAFGSSPAGASGGASTRLRSSLRPLMPPQRSLIRPTNRFTWSAGSPIGIAKPRSCRSSNVTRMCVIAIEFAVMPSSVAFGVSAGFSVVGSQNVSALENRLVRSTSSAVTSPPTVLLVLPPELADVSDDALSSSSPLLHAAATSTSVKPAASQRTDRRDPARARTTFPLRRGAPRRPARANANTPWSGGQAHPGGSAFSASRRRDSRRTSCLARRRGRAGGRAGARR